MADQEKVDKLGSMVAQLKADLHTVENQITCGKYDEVCLTDLTSKLDGVADYINSLVEGGTKKAAPSGPSATHKTTGHK